MASIAWRSPVNGDFSTASYWGGGVVPGSSDLAILNAVGAPFVVTVSTNVTVAGVGLAANATLDIASGADFDATAGTSASASTGTISVASGGVLTLGGSVKNKGVISVAGALSIGGDTTLSGAGQVEFAKGATAAGLVAGVTLVNVDNVVSGGYFGGYTTSNLSITNDAHGTIKNAILDIGTNKSGSNTFSNAGLVLDCGLGGNVFNTGTILVDTGTRAYGGGGVVGARTLVNASLLEATNGGDFFLGENVSNTATGVILAADSAVIELGNNATIEGGHLTTVNGGTISLFQNRATLDGRYAEMRNAGYLELNSGTLNIEGTIKNSGTLGVRNDNHVRRGGLLIEAPGATLNGGGQVDLSQGTIDGAVAGAILTNVSDTISGSGTVGYGHLVLVNGAGGVIDATGGLVVDSATSIVNSGHIEATTGGSLVIQTGTLNDAGGGTVTAGDGSTVTLKVTRLIGGALGSVGSGAIQVVQNATIDGGAMQVTLSGTINLAKGVTVQLQRTIDNTGEISVSAGVASTFTTLEIDKAVTLTGGGQIALHNANDIVSGGTLTNVDNLISGGGLLGDGSTVLVNEAAGSILGDAASALIVDSGANTIVNAGLIVANSGGGLIVKSPLLNDGVLRAVGGTLTLNGAVTGSGSAQISAGTLLVRGAFTENVKFVGTTGVFRLATWAGYTGAIAGLSTTGGNSIDLMGMTFGAGCKASYSGTTTAGILTVTNGTHAAHIHLVGDYLTSTFTISDDGAGGTRVVDPATPPSTSTARTLTYAMASFASRTAAHEEGPPRRRLSGLEMLCARA